MSALGDSGRIYLFARLFAVAAGSLVLANCSGSVGKVDPKWGVSASARVVEPGEPVPKGGGKYRVGKPYQVAGRTYVPEEDPDYKAEGLASWYGDAFHGRYTANGEIFDMNTITAAHPTMPLPSYARVTNLRNRKSIVVRVNDRGPYVGNRVIDLSIKTAKLLEFHGQGIARVKVEYIGRAPLAGSDDRKLMATLRDGNSPVSDKVMVASNKEFAPAFFDSRPLTHSPSLTHVPSPPDRPFRVAGSHQVASLEPAVEEVPVAPPQARMAENVLRAPVSARSAPSTPAVSQVSAYAPTRYDAPAGFMSGRGLY
ncbi:MAG: septal ring lytic transglycosylase RlpA family protein [Pseudolabrys sp.]|nr:septal ring lytic transglycosylase RlpA family protein [Pseudolabrys sp.]MDP2296434.1 septal ring lytic transglycosylase RlpA family protein [Pseudolabrys sp.]